MQRHATSPAAQVHTACHPAPGYASASHIIPSAPSTASALDHLVKGENVTAHTLATAQYPSHSSCAYFNDAPTPSNNPKKSVICALKHAEQNSTANASTAENAKKPYPPTPENADDHAAANVLVNGCLVYHAPDEDGVRGYSRAKGKHKHDERAERNREIASVKHRVARNVRRHRQKSAYRHAKKRHVFAQRKKHGVERKEQNDGSDGKKKRPPVKRKHTVCNDETRRDCNDVLPCKHKPAKQSERKRKAEIFHGRKQKYRKALRDEIDGSLCRQTKIKGRKGFSVCTQNLIFHIFDYTLRKALGFFFFVRKSKKRVFSFCILSKPEIDKNGILSTIIAQINVAYCNTQK